MTVHQYIRNRSQSLRAFFFFVIVFGLLIIFFKGIRLITDWFWFREVGYENVFYITILAKLKIAALFGLVFFILLYSNLFLSIRFSSRVVIFADEDIIQIPSWKVSDKTLQIVIFIGSFLLAAFAGWNSSAEWENFLLLLQGVPFGIPDPLFHKDIGFYVFQFPFLRYLYGWLMFIIILTAVATGGVYIVRRSLKFTPPHTWQVAPLARMHMAILLSLLFFVGTFGLWLDLNGLLFIKRGVVFGPGYTEVTTQLWVLQVMMVVSVLCGLAVISYAFRPDWRIPAVAISVFFLILFIGRGIYPALVQKYKVIPNEIVLEMPYLERNIHYTRMAYRIHDVEEREFPAEESLSLNDLRNNELTIKNIRLWDHGPLLQTYSQLQEMRTYYKFISVDNDRYKIKGEYRQVMLSPRELSYQALPSRTWINEHLTYTHGYGVVLGPVNRVSKEGLPEFFIKDIPPVSSADIKVTRPEIYYGETSNEYVFVRTKGVEFDYPVGDKNVYTRYEGGGGVPLSFWKKLIFAARFGSLTILLSDDITSESRIMYYRKITDRVSRIVPFIRLDGDPYMVISPEGNLFWMVDGYTLTDHFPYSEPTANLGNYIRNSLKAVVDAYHGSVDLYVSDPDDPIIQTYSRIFPGVFKSMDEMPAGLRKHIRYPPGMLAVQARMYRAYHMQDPQVFYNKEDLWAVPGKHTHSGDREMEPYYTIMRLPGEKKEEFILLLPFTPSKKDNMAAWMAARCDTPSYGKVIVYKFPKQKLVYGPHQIEARIDQDAEISKQLSLWHQRGSQVIRGSLLAIPVERSIIYIEPLYLAAEKGQLPELKRVIVAFGNSIAMEENLDMSLQSIFGGKALREREGIAIPVSPQPWREKTERQLVAEALSHYRKAQEYLKSGDWGGYGNELRRMYEILRTIEQKK
ncbi:MAG: UPF0182 family protein [Deltaproteobacteria bacterium]|nr:UPF0182 family protein [Deltaproteobacteria bacterium]